MNDCRICDGIGLVRDNDRNVSKVCECQAQVKLAMAMKRAGLPVLYENASFEELEILPHVRNAVALAASFADNFLPGANEGRGLLLTGSVGTGKTHVAVAIARRIIERCGAAVEFVDVRALLQRLRHSYNSDAQESERQILAPLSRADLVVLDDLGAVRPTDWVFDTTEILIDSLYTAQRRVVVTTNLQNAAPGGGTLTTYQRAAKAETLGDRIGARSWSRLQQMCVSVKIEGQDYRTLPQKPHIVRAKA